MKLRTRIMFLFVSAMIIIASLIIVNYINQSLLFEHLEASLQKIERGLTHNFADESVKLSEQHKNVRKRVAKLTADFEFYRFRTYILTVISSVVVMLLFALGMMSLKKHVVTRLMLLRNFIVEAYHHGIHHRRMNLSGNDELTQFADLFNKALDSIERKNSSREGQRGEDRMIILSLLQNMDKPVAYFRMNGELLGSNLSREHEDAVKNHLEKHITRFQEQNTLEACDPLDALHELRVQAVGPQGRGLMLLRVHLIKKRLPKEEAVISL